MEKKFAVLGIEANHVRGLGIDREVWCELRNRFAVAQRRNLPGIACHESMRAFRRHEPCSEVCAGGHLTGRPRGLQSLSVTFETANHLRVPRATVNRNLPVRIR